MNSLADHTLEKWKAKRLQLIKIQKALTRWSFVRGAQNQGAQGAHLNGKSE